MKKYFIFCLLLMGSTMSAKPIGQEKALFAGGCFWCMESDFEKLSGVDTVISGYIGGVDPNPTYENYAGKGYIEAVEITYDPSIVTYNKLLDFFWRHIDPTDANGQFVDRGKQYRSGIFYLTEEQKKLAEKSKQELQKSGNFLKPTVTEIVKATQFYPAEEYHQDYHTKNPWRYWWYRSNSGRDSFLKKIWNSDTTKQADSNDTFKKPSEAELRNLFDKE